MKHFIKSVKKDLKLHFIDYILLFFGGAVFLLLLKLFQGERYESLILFTTFIAFYVIWSLHHHGKNKVLYLKGVIEYILIGLTILVMLLIVSFV